MLGFGQKKKESVARMSPSAKVVELPQSVFKRMAAKGVPNNSAEMASCTLQLVGE